MNVSKLMILFVLWTIVAVGALIPKKNRFVVYGTMRCPYTVKMIEELKSKNHGYTFVDVSTDQGNESFKKVSSKTSGVPYTVDKKTGEHIIGYRPM